MPPGALLPRRGERLLPLLSALLLVLSFPPLHLPLLPFVALAPFALFLHGRAPDGTGGASALRGGILLGAGYFGLLLHWIPWALARVSAWAVPAYLAVVALLAGLVGVVAWAAHRLSRRGGVPVWLSLPLAWTAGEWLRGHLPGGLAFPWLGLGTSLTGVPEAVGIAEVVGTRGVTLWLALSGGLGSAVVVRVREGRGWGAVATGLGLLVALPVGWGFWRAATLEARPVGRVSVVQPSVVRPREGEPGRSVARTLAVADSLLPGVADAAPGLVVWPETSLPVPLEREAWAGAVDAVERWSRRVGAPVLLGAYGSETGGDDGRHNSAFLVAPGEGRTGYRYDKRFLVPMIESGDLFGWSRGADGGPARDLRPGTGSLPLVRAAGGAFGVLICYESAFSGLARGFRIAGADVLVNLTNDAWFGGEAWWARTGGLWQHPVHLVMRAIETRVGIVRAANTGVSFVVDPRGRIRHRTPLFRPAALTGLVETTDVRTVFARLGDVAGTGCALLAFLLLLGTFSPGRGVPAGERKGGP